MNEQNKSFLGNCVQTSKNIMFIAHRRVAQTAVRHFRSLNLIASAA